MPVERKMELSNANDSNYDNYVFKDRNNVFEKFLGKWFFKDSKYAINLEIYKQFDVENKQDGIYINLRLIKDNDTLINTLPFTKANYIAGGFFENKKNLNTTSVFLSEISSVWRCGAVSKVYLSRINDNLIWEIDDKQLFFNATASLFPSTIKFTR